jgi:serine/threonine protein kinase
MELKNVWPEWKVKKLIGEGGFGKVYEITRNSYGIDERRAMKVISIPTCQAEYERTLSDGMDEASATSFYRSMVNEFVKEISILSQLRGSSNIVVYDDYKVVEHSDSFGWDIYIMMELLTPLSKVLRNGAMSQQKIVKVGTDICDALTSCHNSGILHRDIKIDNIFVSKDGVYKLGDFGIARKAEQTLGVYTKTGTESYMAPEVYKGEPYGKRADIYSLGMVLYRLTNNNRDPFLPPYPQPITVSDKNYSMVRRMKGEALPKPENASDELGTVILKACAYHQSDRFQSAEEFKRALLNPSASSMADTYNDRPVDTDDDVTQSAFSTSREVSQRTSNSQGLYSDDVSRTQSAFTGLTREDPISPLPATPPASKKKTGVLIAVIAALVVGIGVVIALIAINGNNDNDSYSNSNAYQTTSRPESVPHYDAATKEVQVIIEMEFNDDRDYEQTLFIDSEDYSYMIPQYAENHKKLRFKVEICEDKKLQLKLNDRLYYECDLDLETGTCINEKKLKNNFQ